MLCACRVAPHVPVEASGTHPTPWCILCPSFFDVAFPLSQVPALYSRALLLYIQVTQGLPRYGRRDIYSGGLKADEAIVQMQPEIRLEENWMRAWWCSAGAHADLAPYRVFFFCIV